MSDKLLLAVTMVNFTVGFLTVPGIYTMTRGYRGVAKYEEYRKIEREDYAERLEDLREEVEALQKRVP